MDCFVETQDRRLVGSKDCVGHVLDNAPRTTIQMTQSKERSHCSEAQALGCGENQCAPGSAGFWRLEIELAASLDIMARGCSEKLRHCSLELGEAPWTLPRNLTKSDVFAV